MAPVNPDHLTKREDVWSCLLSKYDLRDIILSDKTDEQLAGIYKVTTKTITNIRRHYL